MQSDRNRRTPPSDMPRQAAPPSRDALRGKPKPRDVLPEQTPVTDEVESVKKPAKWKRVLALIVTGVLLVLALAAAYVFLLLGEPDEEAKQMEPTVEKAIAMPMSAMESLGETNLQPIANDFAEPMLALQNSGLVMQRARVYDTAFAGGYARRATITYSLPDGAQINVESIRPVAAVTLLSLPNARLETGSLYTLGGVNAAMMTTSTDLCVFGQSDTAVYAVTCPAGYDEQVKTLLRQTQLLQPDTDLQ